MPDSYVQGWEDELPEHPVIAELRAQPGRWAFLWKPGLPPPDSYFEAKEACVRHPRIQDDDILEPSGYPGNYNILGTRARWIPDEEWRCGKCDD